MDDDVAIEMRLKSQTGGDDDALDDDTGLHVGSTPDYTVGNAPNSNDDGR